MTQVFRYDWSRFDARLGLIFMIGLLLVFRLTGRFEFAWLAADPTIVANATLNVISPSLTQTWRLGLERVVLGTAGILGGFYFGWLFLGEFVGQAVTAVGAFVALGVARVSFGFVIGALFFFLSYPWGTMQSEAGHLIANEKLVGELAGVFVAIWILAGLERRVGSATN